MDKKRIFKALDDIEATIKKKTVKGYINELKKDPEYKKGQREMMKNFWIDDWDAMTEEERKEASRGYDKVYIVRWKTEEEAKVKLNG